MTNFECLYCGRCCEKIITTNYGISAGMYLKPSEKWLFRRYPSAVMPYLGIGKVGASKPKKILLYQLAVEPCPLYDAGTKRCTQYESRPVACRAYPFTLEAGRLMVAEECKWLEDHDFKRGDEIKADAIRYAHEIHDIDFAKYAATRESSNLPEGLIFDVQKKKWLKIKEKFAIVVK